VPVKSSRGGACRSARRCKAGASSGERRRLPPSREGGRGGAPGGWPLTRQSQAPGAGRARRTLQVGTPEEHPRHGLFPNEAAVPGAPSTRVDGGSTVRPPPPPRWRWLGRDRLACASWGGRRGAASRRVRLGRIFMQSAPGQGHPPPWPPLAAASQSATLSRVGGGATRPRVGSVLLVDDCTAPRRRPCRHPRDDALGRRRMSVAHARRIQPVSNSGRRLQQLNLSTRTGACPLGLHGGTTRAGTGGSDAVGYSLRHENARQPQQ